MGTPMPVEELWVIDETVRMFVNPVLRADTNMLARLWESEEKSKQEKMQALGVVEADLQSADKFQALLEAEGIEIEYKEGKNGPIPAFAKTDQFMRDLLEHDNERVRLLAAARLGVKSTLLQTRAETLGWMGSRGPLPVYLRYAGAHTTRWSGGDGCNWQNFKRGSDIRKAILAPEGYLLGIIDLSQIERRICAYLSGEWDYLDRFRRGEDPYIGTASRFYKRQITKDDKIERQAGKTIELLCQFGGGGTKIVQTLKNVGITITQEEGVEARDAFRAEHPLNVELWKLAGRMISRLAGGPPCDWGPMWVKDGKIYLPNGCPLDYTTLQFHKDPENGDSYWRVKKRNGWTKLYGGKLVENVVQALARVVLSQAFIRIKHGGFRTVLTSHDELVILIPDDGQSAVNLDRCRQEMVRVPDWLPSIPLDAEAQLSERYSK